MQKYAEKNKGYGYFIVAIDIMSRFAWCEIIKTPSGEEVKKALERIFKKGRLPSKIRTDKGTEYNNEIMTGYYGKENIDHFVTQNELKANFAERCIRTIKGKLMQYMRAKHTHEWISVLENITSSYNNTFHRSIKQTPASVSKKDEIKLWQELYLSQMKPPLSKISYKFNIGDLVRISKLRQAFQRYYSEHWTNEFFIIKNREMQEYIPTYKLTDYDGEEIKGTFYETELQRVYAGEDTEYNIEKIEKRRQRNRVKEVLIKWMGWPRKFNTWIPASEVKNYK